MIKASPPGAGAEEALKRPDRMRARTRAREREREMIYIRDLSRSERASEQAVFCLCNECNIEINDLT
jgi:hypothetical protein